MAKPKTTPKSDTNEPAAEWVETASMVPWDRNPRRNDANVKRVMESIKRFGFGAPIVARRANREIIAGHTRLKAAHALGLDKVPVRFLDLDPADAHLLALADNRLNELSPWDPDGLAKALGDFSLADVELAGWTGADLEAMGTDLLEGLGELDEPREGGKAAGEGSDEREHGDSDDVSPAGAGEPDEGDAGESNAGESEAAADVIEDEAPEPPKVPLTKPGDVWELGDHVLVCGRAEDYRPDVMPNLLLCDPPYGMGLDTRLGDKFMSHDRTRKGPTGERFAPIEGDDRPFDASALIAAHANVKEQVWWGADYYRGTIEPGGSWYVWDKRGNDAGMRLDAVAGNVFELAWSRRSHKREILRVLWSGHHGMQREDTRVRVHPSQKPVAVAAFFVERLTSPGDLVLDLFGGSGSTLIACEQLGRRARLVELSPAYCDVIVARWEALTGKKATRRAAAQETKTQAEVVTHGA